jgi:hypothetical protein
VVAHDPTSSCTAVPSTIGAAGRQHCGDAAGLLEILRKVYGAYAIERIFQLLFIEGDPCDTTYQNRAGKYQNQPERVTLARV